MGGHGSSLHNQYYLYHPYEHRIIDHVNESYSILVYAEQTFLDLPVSYRLKFFL